MSPSSTTGAATRTYAVQDSNPRRSPVKGRPIVIYGRRMKMQASVDLAPGENMNTHPTNCIVVVRILAGELGVGGEESFDVSVCTPVWLAEHVAAEGPLVGRHHLIVDHFRLDQVQA